MAYEMRKGPNVKEFYAKYRTQILYGLSALAGAQFGPVAGGYVRSYGPSLLDGLAKVLGG